MRNRVRTEEIYDAAMDDAAFERLPTVMAETFDARSAVMHWSSPDGSAGELADTGYFPEEQMLEYDRHFASADLWSEAMNLPGTANRAWDSEQLIPGKAYERSKIYNDWVRPMGDDTFHCVGMAIKSSWGTADVGLHRGRSQGPFDPHVLDELNQNLGHIRRMLGIRARLAEASGSGKVPAAALDALAHGMIALTPTGKVLHLNAAAEAMLRAGSGLYLRKGQLCAKGRGDDEALQKAIALAGDAAGTKGTDLRIRKRPTGTYMLSLVSVNVGAGRQVIVIVTDPAAACPGTETRLRALFGLTASEAYLAVRLSEGATSAEIAVARGVSIGTIRVQLKSVAAKLGCARQAEIVSLVKDLPRLKSQ